MSYYYIYNNFRVSNMSRQLSGAFIMYFGQVAWPII